MMERVAGWMRMWSVSLPSLLHEPHKYILEAAPYIVVVLVESKKLEQ